jgi:uncharacterized protein (DUF1501 family)
VIAVKTSRRDFLNVALGSSLVLSIDGHAPLFLNQALAEDTPRSDTILIVVQLSGGNDGVNTVIPYTDDVYHRSRPKLAIAQDQVLKLDDRIGLHPSMRGLSEMYQDGMLAIVQGVGYPSPNRSHFESMDIWHTCYMKHQRSDEGWLGRYLDQTRDQTALDPPAMHVGPEKQPYALSARYVRTPSVFSLDQFQLRTEGEDRSAEAIRSLTQTSPASDGGLLDFVHTSTQSALTASQRLEIARRDYQTPVEYPDSGLAQKLRIVAQLIGAGLATRVYYMELDGFDTHAQQRDAHAALLSEFSAGVKAFMDDAVHQKFADRVLVLSFSEFGRRLAENASEGTDHGAAAPVFLAGGRVKGGLVGAQPSLTDLDDGDLKHHTDFRQLYATVLERWLHCPSESALGGRYDLLPCV